MALSHLVRSLPHRLPGGRLFGAGDRVAAGIARSAPVARELAGAPCSGQRAEQQ